MDACKWGGITELDDCLTLFNLDVGNMERLQQRTFEVTVTREDKVLLLRPFTIGNTNSDGMSQILEIQFVVPGF